MNVAGDPGLIVAGIDPGLTGALAVLNEANECETVSMPVVDGVVDAGAVVRWLGDHDTQLAVIERQQAMPAQWIDRIGKLRKQGVTSAFKIGQAYGTLLGALGAALIPYRIVGPTEWKSAMRLSSDKEQSRRKAIELLPLTAARGQFSRKLDEARAEAALIAWWYLHERSKSKEEKETVAHY